MKFEIFTVTVLWFVTSCSLVFGYQGFPWSLSNYVCRQIQCPYTRLYSVKTKSQNANINCSLTTTTTVMSLAWHIETQERKKNATYVSRVEEMEKREFSSEMSVHVCKTTRCHCYSMVKFIYSPKINWSFLNHKTFTSMSTGIFKFIYQISNLFQLKRLKLKEWRKHNLNLQ